MKTTPKSKGFKPKLVYIASDVRSGSTLLDMILGGHSQILSIGELQFLNDHFNRKGFGVSWDWQCTCGQQFKDCPFWSTVDQRFAQNNGKALPDTKTWVKRVHHPMYLLLAGRLMLKKIARCSSAARIGIETAQNCWQVLDEVQKHARFQFIVDSSKNAEQLKYMHYVRPEDIFLIFLVRDGRGVVHSKKTRVGDSIRRAAKNWVLENIKILFVSLFIQKRRRIFVRYEDFCRDPAGELDRIYRMLSLPNQGILYTKHDRHNVCGSPHRFDRGNTEIRLDERWKTSLTKGEQLTFAIVGGWLNRLMGFR